MSVNSSTNDALGALLADSAASAGSQDSHPVRTASKFENTFVTFDDLVPLSEPIAGLVPTGGDASSLKEDIKEKGIKEGEDIKIMKEEEDVLNAPHLVLIGTRATKLCCAVPTSVAGSKWCYDTSECLIKTHTKATKFDI